MLQLNFTVILARLEGPRHCKVDQGGKTTDDMEVSSIHVTRRRHRSPESLRAIAFHVLTPLLLVMFTATETGYNRTFGYGGAIVYMSFFAFLSWWTAELATRLAKYVLSPWQPSLLPLALAGAILACVVVSLYAPFLEKAVFALGFPLPETAASPADAWGSPREIMMQSARAVFFWVAANFLFDRYLGMPRFRYASQLAQPSISPDVWRGARGEELGRMLKRFSSVEEIWAIKAEEHYVRVIGKEREELILCRFSDALRAVAEEDGFRVHRSYWVRRSPLVSREIVGKRMNLIMSNGLKIPVSRRYHELVEQIVRPPAES